MIKTNLIRRIFIALFVLSCFVIILLYLLTSSTLSFKERYIRPGETRDTINAHPKIINQYFCLYAHTAKFYSEYFMSLPEPSTFPLL